MVGCSSSGYNQTCSTNHHTKHHQQHSHEHYHNQKKQQLQNTVKQGKILIRRLIKDN